MMRFLILLSFTFVSAIADPKVLLQEIQVLTFQQGQYTTGRRTSPLPQIQCISGCGQYVPSQVQCQNMGFDGTDVNWKCDTELPEGVRFSQINVGCEGYDYPDDPYVLIGSCQVVFSLTSTWYTTESTTGGLTLFLFLLFIVICVSACCCCCFWNRSQQSQQLPQYIPVATAVNPSNSYPSAPPLPMNPSYVPPPVGGSGYGYGYGRGGGGGGGYWSGLGTGGALGYMFGRSSSNRGWGWGSGGGGGGYSHHSHHSSPSRSIPMTHHATGFARTQRR